MLYKKADSSALILNPQKENVIPFKRLDRLDDGRSFFYYVGMIESNGYVLVYKPKENQIVITLPQTFSTLTNTLSPVVERRIDICTEEEAAILNVVKAIFEK